MSGTSDSTLPSRRIPSVVLVAPAPELLDALQRVVRCLDETPSMKTATLTDAATVVAEWRPFAVIVAADILAFDPAEFQALARDVGAEVIAYDADAGAHDVAAALLPGLEAALLLWMTSEFAGL
jgi:hypothetical protein